MENIHCRAPTKMATFAIFSFSIFTLLCILHCTSIKSKKCCPWQVGPCVQLYILWPFWKEIREKWFSTEYFLKNALRNIVFGFQSQLSQYVDLWKSTSSISFKLYFFNGWIIFNGGLLPLTIKHKHMLTLFNWICKILMKLKHFLF